METLPWLLVHGPAVWQVGLALVLSASVLVVILRPRKAAAESRTEALRRLGAPVDGSKAEHLGQRVTIEGKLELGEALAVTVGSAIKGAAAGSVETLQGKNTWGFASDTRAETLRLATAGQTIELRGLARVLSGADEVRRARTIVHAVSAGDVVRVSGMLRREAPEGGAAGYRGGAQLTLSGEDGAPLEVVYAAEPRVRGPGALAMGRAAAVSGGLFLAIAAALGEGAYAIVGSTVHEVEAEGAAPGSGGSRAPVLRGLAAASLAAATPLRGPAAVGSLTRALDQSPYQDARRADLRAALHELSGDCEGASEVLLGSGELERGAALAERCGKTAEAAHAAFTLGDFGRASSLEERAARGPSAITSLSAEARFGVLVHLLARRPVLAARAARRLADSLREGAAAGDLAKTMDCLADAIDATAGDKLARDRLAGDRLARAEGLCAVLRADVLGLPRSPLALEAGASARWAEALEADLEADAGERSTCPAERLSEGLEDPALFLVSPAQALAGSLPGVDRAAALRLEEGAPSPKRARAAARAAGFAIAAGDHADAERFTRLAAAALDEEGLQKRCPGGAWDSAHASLLGAAAALGAGATHEARERLGPLEDLERSGLRALATYRERGEPSVLRGALLRWGLVGEPFYRGLEALGAGDGAALVTRMHDGGAQLPPFRLGGGRLRSGQSDLLRLIDVGFWRSPWPRPLAEHMVQWENLAAAAEAAQNPRLAAELRDRGRHFRDALLRRDTAVPIAVLERL